MRKAAGRKGESLHLVINRRAGADEIAIAVWIVDSSDGGPELVIAQPRRGIRGLIAGILARPAVTDQGLRGVRRAFQCVVRAIHLAFFDRVNLLADFD